MGAHRFPVTDLHLPGGGSVNTPSAHPYRFRLSRPCYDKFRRCPGWAGGGNRHARTVRCDGGMLDVSTPAGTVIRAVRWRFLRCHRCGTVVAPSVIRHIDPTNLPYTLRRWGRRFLMWRRDRAWAHRAP